MSFIIKGSAIIFLFISFCARTQNDDKSTKVFTKVLSGTIILNDGEKISGDFTLSPEDVLTPHAPNSANVYTPRDVLSFYFLDKESNTTRYFYSLPFKIEEPTFYFFELIHQTDQISILGRLELGEEHDGLGSVSKFLSTMVLLRSGRVGKTSNGPNYKAVYRRYLLDHRHNVIYALSKTKLLELIGDSAETLNYVNTQHYKLDEDQFSQYAEVVDFYSNSKKPLTK